MKKFIIPIIALALTAGAVNAQTTSEKTSTSHSAASVNKISSKKMATATSNVSPTKTAATTKKTNTDVATIKRKHPKKKKSVKPVSK